MGCVAAVHHGRNVGFGLLNGCLKARGCAELPVSHPFTGVLTCCRSRGQGVEQSVTAQWRSTVKARARCIPSTVQAGKPASPCANHAASEAVDGKPANGVANGGRKRDGLPVHVNARTLFHEAEEGPPPCGALAHVASVENGLNSGVDRLCDA